MLLKILLILSIFSTIFGSENRIKIGIIDSGISVEQNTSNYLCKKGMKSFVGDAGFDKNGHGTNVFGLIAKQINPKTHCIISYSFYKESETNTNRNISALLQANRDGISFLNMSFGGMGTWAMEIMQIDNLLKKGVKVIVASGNWSQNLDKKCNFYPACYKETVFKKEKNFIVVGSNNLKKSNYGNIVNVTEEGYEVGTPSLSGTSQSTAIHTGKIAYKKHGIIKQEK